MQKQSVHETSLRSSWKSWYCALVTALTLTCMAVEAHAESLSADAPSADIRMKQLIDRVSTDLNTLHKANRIGDHAAIESLIRTDILPSIDKDRLSRRVFRQYWAQLEKAGRTNDAQERVMQSLIRTYAAALSGYSGDTISLVSVVPRDKGSVAKTRLRRPTGETIQVDFNIAQVGDEWLINDMAVDGIVISLTFFNAIKPVWDQQGIDAALNTLADVDVNAESKTQKDESKSAKPKN